MTDDFYEVGKAYKDRKYSWEFRPLVITRNPDDGERVAIGWYRFCGQWKEYAYYEEDWDSLQTKLDLGWVTVEDL